jgi:catechol 2,3-dioxygenase-like lactoylglutathione lyase family enzyme
MRLGHIALSVSDIKRSAAFFRKYFSFRSAEKYVYKDAGLTIALLEKDDITLEFFEFKNHRSLPQYRKILDNDLHTIGVKHFSFDTKNIKGLYNRFKKTGVKFATEMRVTDGGKRYFFVKDPDGNLVELMEL